MVAGLSTQASVTLLDDHRLLAATTVRTAEYDLDQVAPVGIARTLDAPISRLLVEPSGDGRCWGRARRCRGRPGRGAGVTGLELPLETEGPMALLPDGRLVAAPVRARVPLRDDPTDPGLPRRGRSRTGCWCSPTGTPATCCSRGR